VTGSIIAGSQTGPNCSGTISEVAGYNLDSGTTCVLSDATDLTATDPLLGPLTANGGPTLTMALLGGSPAIDHGGSAANGCPATDQRGVVRPQAAACDIGAYEFNSPGPPSGCVGDCHNDGHTTVDDILTMVNIALGTATCSECVTAHCPVTIDQILTAVNNALNGCPAQ
jgi:hypothetical protein